MRHATRMILGTLVLLAGACAHRPPDPPEILRQRYEACMSRGAVCLAETDYLHAAQAYEEALRYVPGSSPAHARLGFAYLKLKKIDLAEQMLLEAVALDPGNMAAHCNLGVISVRNRKYAEARERLERAAALGPDFPLAHFSLGNLLMHMGDFAGARKALGRAFELDPGLAISAPASTVGFQDDPQPLGTALGYGRIYASAGNLEETVRYLEEARRLGYRDWRLLLAEPEFDKVRGHPRIRAFLD